MTPPPPPMPVEVRYFAAAREGAGLTGERLDVPVGLTAGGLLALLAGRHPGLAPVLPGLRVAVNERFVPAEAALAAGDTVALIPPVSGG